MVHKRQTLVKIDTCIKNSNNLIMEVAIVTTNPTSKMGPGFVLPVSPLRWAVQGLLVHCEWFLGNQWVIENLPNISSRESGHHAIDI